jgi:hypothetical protein
MSKYTLSIWTRLYYRLLHQWLMKFTHRHHWHYMPISGPFDDGTSQAWCHWCGIRCRLSPDDPTISLRALLEPSDE